jgi:DNA polymerase III epsilon subunit-like protein
MYVVVDLETTGGVYNKEKIIEIGMIKYDGLKGD